jgi:hypothetical protein
VANANTDAPAVPQVERKDANTLYFLRCLAVATRLEAMFDDPVGEEATTPKSEARHLDLPPATDADAVRVRFPESGPAKGP